MSDLFVFADDGQGEAIRVESLDVASYLVQYFMQRESKPYSVVDEPPVAVASINVVTELSDELQAWIEDGGQVEAWQSYKLASNGLGPGRPNYAVEFTDRTEALEFHDFRVTVNPDNSYELMPRVDRRRLNGGARPGSGPKIPDGLNKAVHRWAYWSSERVESMLQQLGIDPTAPKLRSIILDGLNRIAGGQTVYFNPDEPTRITEYAIRLDDQTDERLSRIGDNLGIPTKQDIIETVLNTELNYRLALDQIQDMSPNGSTSCNA